MTYVENNLIKDEEVKFFAHIHYAIFSSSIISFIIVLIIAISNLSSRSSLSNPTTIFNLILFLIPIFIFPNALIIKLTTEFAVTNKRIIAKVGFFQRHTLEILLQKVESIQVNQSIIGRIFNYGSITVIGSGGTKQKFVGITNPIEIRNKTNQVIEDSVSVSQA